MFILDVIKDAAFYATPLFAAALLWMLIYSIRHPDRRIWPPKDAPRYRLYWWTSYAVYAGIAILYILELPKIAGYPWWQLIIGIAMIAGGGLFDWRARRALGVKQTSGLNDRFVKDAPPYDRTRNPQYVGLIVLFLGLSLLAPSYVALLAVVMKIAWFWLAPAAEEPWLREQYGQEFDDYARNVPRWL